MVIIPIIEYLVPSIENFNILGKVIYQKTSFGLNALLVPNYKQPFLFLGVFFPSLLIFPFSYNFFINFLNSAKLYGKPLSPPYFKTLISFLTTPDD